MFYYCETGEGKPVIFLHGWGANGAIFSGVAKSVKAHCYLLDFYGHGKTSYPEPKVLNVRDYAEGVLEFMDSLNIKSADFVGHSFGGRVAIELAAYFPERVNRLVLVDSAGIKSFRGLKYYVKIAIHKILKKFGRGLKGSEDYRKLSDVQKRTFINIVNYDQTHLLKKIHSQTAVFWGDKDKATPLSAAKKIVKNVKNSHLFLLKGAGHYSFIDNPREFNVILSAYLRG